MTLAFHPLAQIFPLLDGAEFDALRADIAANGVREPVILYEGQILDGRNRYRASQAAGVDCPMRTYDGDDPLAYVVSLNLRRRHLDESQRAMAAAKIATLKHGSNQWSGQLAAPTQEAAASLLNVGERSVRRAREVLDDGAPELVEAVERGKVAVSAAAEIASLPKHEQREIVARGRDEIVKEANRLRREEKELRREERKKETAQKAAAVAPRNDRYELVKGDCSDAVLAIAENSVDLIITDPPYPKEFLPLYDELGELAAKALKPGGSLLCMIGQSYLPDIVATLDKHLTYHWTMAYMTPGGQAAQIFPRRVNTFWKPVLWFVKRTYAGEAWIGDAVSSKTNDNDKRFHDWGQSESGMRDLMARFVRPGDVVLDPFMGAGTTGVVALDLGATFIGYDPDEAAFNEAMVRMGDASLVA